MAGKDEDTREKQIEKYALGLFNRLKRQRKFVEPLWMDVADYLLPQFTGLQFEQIADMTAGEKIYDGEALAAHSRLSDGMFGWVVSPTIPWIKFEPTDKKNLENMKAMQYLTDLEMYLYDVFNRSNFYDMIATDIKTCSGIGTSVMTVEDAPELGRPIYESLNPTEFYISENRYHEVDTLAREYMLTPDQLLEEFGDDYSDKEKSEISAYDRMFKLVQIVYPNRDFIDDGFPKLAGSKKIKSIHIILDGPKPKKNKTGVLKISGMDYQKFLAWRFMRVSNQVYGTCPGIDAIYDIKMINMQSKTMADVGQLAARPPVWTDDEMKGKIRLSPGGITYGKYEVKPIVTSLSYPIGMDAMARRAQIIREHFKTDFFMSISQLQNSSRDRTATEIMEIKAEAAAVMGSIVGRIQSERLEPLVRLTIAIERDAGRLPKPPADVDPTIAFKLNFIGPLAQSQRKYLRVQGISQGLGAALQLSQYAPNVIMNFDINKAGRELAQASGLKPEFIFPEAMVKKMQDAAAKQAAQAQQFEMENERMKASGQGTSAPEPGSVTDAMMKASQKGVI